MGSPKHARRSLALRSLLKEESGWTSATLCVTEAHLLKASHYSSCGSPCHGCHNEYQQRSKRTCLLRERNSHSLVACSRDRPRSRVQ
jgi:hypothetical protein